MTPKNKPGNKTPDLFLDIDLGPNVYAVQTGSERARTAAFAVRVFFLPITERLKLTIEGVTKIYKGKVTALRDLSLEVGPGILAGCGKRLSNLSS